jgi:hypothetical protein
VIHQGRHFTLALAQNLTFSDDRANGLLQNPENWGLPVQLCKARIFRGLPVPQVNIGSYSRRINAGYSLKIFSPFSFYLTRSRTGTYVE